MALSWTELENGIGYAVGVYSNFNGEIRFSTVLYSPPLPPSGTSPARGADASREDLEKLKNTPLQTVWHVFPVRTENRDVFQKYLTDNGIQTIIHYPTPPHKQLAYKEWNSLSFPISEEIHRTIISLPISPVMTDDEVKKVVEVVNGY